MISLIGIGWFIAWFELYANYDKGLVSGLFENLAGKGFVPHLAPLVSGLVIFVAGLSTTANTRKMNAIAFLIAIGLLIGYLYWMWS